MGIRKTLYATTLLFALFLLPYVVIAEEKITKPWVVGYLTVDWYRGGSEPIGILNRDDWDTLTHIVHHAAGLNVSNGSLQMDYVGDYLGTLDNSAKRIAVIDQAHRKGVPILFSVVNFGGYSPVLADPTKRRRLINELIQVLKNGYDGLDIDLEPVTADSSGNNPDYEAFIDELHEQMQAINQTNNSRMVLKRPLLTIATGVEVVTDNDEGSLRKLLNKIQNKLDQINVMTYDLSTIDGQITWHDSALFDGGNRYPTNPDRSMISASRSIQQFIDAGVLPSKLGLGISQEIRVWRGGRVSGSSDGVTAPLQRWSAQPSSWDSDGNVIRGRYAELMKSSFNCIRNANYDCSYKPEYYRWDDDAKMPYLSINRSGSEGDMFISYNDARSVHEKVKYVKEQGLGGVMLWELGRECLYPGGGGSRDACVPGDGKYRPLMKAVRQTLRTGNCD